MDFNSKNSVKKDADNASLFVEDSGIDLSKRAPLRSSVWKEKEHSDGNESKFELCKKESKECLGTINENNSENLLLAFVCLKSKISVANELIYLEMKRFVYCADKDAVKSVCEDKLEKIAEANNDESLNCEEDLCDAHAITNKVVSTNEEVKAQSDDDPTCGFLAEIDFKATDTHISDLLLKCQSICTTNKGLARSVNNYRMLNEDLRESHRECERNTEKTLAGLGEYVMDSRKTSEQYNDLIDEARFVEMERVFVMERLQEARAMIDALEEKVAEAEEKAEFWKKEACNAKLSHEEKCAE
eukprot:gene16828-18526_t